MVKWGVDGFLVMEKVAFCVVWDVDSHANYGEFDLSRWQACDFVQGKMMTMMCTCMSRQTKDSKSLSSRRQIVSRPVQAAGRRAFSRWIQRKDEKSADPVVFFSFGFCKYIFK